MLWQAACGPWAVVCPPLVYKNLESLFYWKSTFRQPLFCQFLSRIKLLFGKWVLKEQNFKGVDLKTQSLDAGYKSNSLAGRKFHVAGRFWPAGHTLHFLGLSYCIDY